MKKNLLSIGLLAAGLAVNAQVTSTPSVLTHVDNGALFYVGKGALVYNGGGLQTKGDATSTGTIENHGNIMVVGNGTTDVLRTLNGTTDKAEGATVGGVIINKLNEPTAYTSVNVPDVATTPADESAAFTYGQLYISGLSQNNIAAQVTQEYRQVKHGDYQQIGLPFYDKTFSSLSSAAEFGKTFNTSRWTKNEILWWNNAGAVFENLPSISAKTMGPTSSHGYYILGSLGMDSSSKVYTITGRPYAESNTPSVQLKDGGNVPFGTGGNSTNAYNEKYNTYLQDGFSATTPWSGNYGKNIYQFANPYLTNLDLHRIAHNESAAVGDGNFLSNIQGVRLEVSGVQFTANVGGGSTSYKFVTFTGGIPIGDDEYLNVRPFGTFAIKLLDNTTQPNLNFTTLRRFNYLGRAANVNYSVSANKSSANSSGTVKELAVIGLNAAGNEVGRTYYVVSNYHVTGHHPYTALAQVTAPSTAPIGTFEEAANGGYDTNFWSNYWLYINEANETDFLGKNVKLVDYTTAGSNKITQLRFEVDENAVAIANGQHALSTGIGFYYKKANGTATPIAHGDTVPAAPLTGNFTEYDLYYGAPNSAVLATSDAKSSRTLVVYDSNSDNYVVMFDPNWKTADIQVYDMSGKLVVSAKSVKTDQHYVIPVDKNTKGGYIVNVLSNSGDKVSSKILR